jgi:archaellum component FlaF (FlaF/FlaG flagellin family)
MNLVFGFGFLFLALIVVAGIVYTNIKRSLKNIKNAMVTKEEKDYTDLQQKVMLSKMDLMSLGGGGSSYEVKRLRDKYCSDKG